MNLAFAGTPEFAEIALSALLAGEHRVSLVLTQPDRPAGRGMKLQPSPVKATAIKHGLPVLQPISLRNGEHATHAIDALRRCHHGTPPDVLVVAAYGLLLPQEVLEIPRLGCLNIHASILPRWRGAAPIHRAIESGDHQSGITIMQMDAGLDTGAMRLVNTLEISSTETTAILHNRLATLGAKSILEALSLLEQGTLPLITQPNEGITYAQKISKSEAWLNWHEPADVLARRLRAFNPFPGGFAQVLLGGLNSNLSPPSTQQNGMVLKLWAGKAVYTGELFDEGLDKHGLILSIGPEGVLIQCGRGQLLVTELQKPSGKRLQIKEAWPHLGLSKGDRLISTPSNQMTAS